MIRDGTRGPAPVAVVVRTRNRPALLAEALESLRSQTARPTRVVVVNDGRALYEGILGAAGLRLEERSARHVNRRTGRRNGEYFEDVLVAVPARRRIRPRA